MKVTKNNTTILKGIRNQKDGLWDIPISKKTITKNCSLQPPLHGVLYKTHTAVTTPESHHVNKKSSHKNVIPKHLQSLSCLAVDNDFNNAIDQQLQKDKVSRNNSKLNIILRKKETHMNLIKYLHASCFSPVPSTFKKAIKKGFLQSWPGLTTKMVDKYLPPSEATAKGHIRQERQHLQSTKSNKTTNKHPIYILCEKTAALSLNQIPKPSSLSTQNNEEPYMNNKKHNSVAYILIDHDEMVAGYMDLTGRFPQRSSRGNNYILVGYHYDADAILAKPIKDRTANVITDAWRSMHESFEQSGQEPTIYILDNEKSKVLTDMFLSKGVKYQLASPNNHRTNLAERSIQTYKSQFKAGLATCDPTFPL